MVITYVLRRVRAVWLVSTCLLAVTASALVGCANLEATVSAARETATPTPAVTPLPLSSPTPAPTPVGARLLPLTARPPQTPAMGRALPDERVAEVMALLLERHPDETLLQEALDEVVANRDVRFIAPLVELMRAGPMQLGELSQAHIDALETLTGWAYSQSWDRWVEWYGRADLSPPPGFASWKGELLSRLDERYGEFLSVSKPTAIDLAELVWSGLLPDGTLPLDDPPFVAARSRGAAYLDSDEPVFGVVVNGEPYAYPLRIMDVHQIANHQIGGVPVTLGYSPMTGSAVLFDRRAADGETYSFSSSGLVYQSDQLMYDRETWSLWSPLLGRPLVGPLVDAASGTHGPWLDVWPVVTARWGEWVARHPDTQVLAAHTGASRSYLLGFPHLEYFSSGDTAFPVSRTDDRQLTKAWVYGIDVDGTTKAYPLRTVFSEGVVNDRMGEVDVVLVGEGRGRGIRVEGELPMYGEVRYFAGGTIRAYERPDGESFSRGFNTGTVLDGRGRTWQVTEDGLVSPDGEVAPRVFGQLLYWFAWQAFHPDTDVYETMLPTAGP